MTLTVPEKIASALELLDKSGATISTIAISLRANRLDRMSLLQYLCDYADRAASDGHLINASRHLTMCQPWLASSLRSYGVDLLSCKKTTIPSHIRPSNDTVGGKYARNTASPWSFAAKVPFNKAIAKYQEHSRSGIRRNRRKKCKQFPIRTPFGVLIFY